MDESRFIAEHVSLTTDKPFEEVANDLVRQLGRFDPEILRLSLACRDPEKARTKINSMAGPSGFMLFGTSDHGLLLGLVGRPRKALQFVVGNPAIALEMTQHDLRRPLRPAATPPLSGRTRPNLLGIRQALLPRRPIRQRLHHPHGRPARPETRGVDSKRTGHRVGAAAIPADVSLLVSRSPVPVPESRPDSVQNLHTGRSQALNSPEVAISRAHLHSLSTLCDFDRGQCSTGV